MRIGIVVELTVAVLHCVLVYAGCCTHEHQLQRVFSVACWNGFLHAAHCVFCDFDSTVIGWEPWISMLVHNSQYLPLSVCASGSSHLKQLFSLLLHSWQYRSSSYKSSGWLHCKHVVLLL